MAELIKQPNVYDTLLKVADEAQAIIGSTYGPRGRYVLLWKGSEPVVTNDGVTIAQNLSFSNPPENAVFNVIKQASLKTNDEVGDGTTAAIILASAFIKQAVSEVKSGANPVLLKRGMEWMLEKVANFIEEQAIPVASPDQIFQVATISANGDTIIGELVTEAYMQIDENGMILPTRSETNEDYVQKVEGYFIDRSFISPYLARGPVTEYNDVYVMLVDTRLWGIRPYLSLLDKAIGSGKPLLIIAEDIEGEFLQTLLANRVQRNLPLAAVKAPEYGDKMKQILEDIAVITGGTVIGMSVRPEAANLSHLGRASKVVIDAERTVIVGENPSQDKLRNRIEQLKELIKKNDEYRDFYEERLAKLTGGIALLKVAGRTDAEYEERRMRVDDALSAATAAAESGIVPGGATIFLRVYKYFKDQVETLEGFDKLTDDEKKGAQILIESLKEPIVKLAENSGVNPEELITNLMRMESPQGFDALRLRYCNLIKEGIIDPVKVPITALQSAVSASGLLITTSSIYVEDTQVKGEFTAG